MATKKTPRAIAVCSFELQASANAVQILPAGAFRSSDTRPDDVPAWHVTPGVAAQLVAAAAARKIDYVIDYEHQTLASEHNGQPAPAAGWFRRLEWRDGQGLFATDVAWTAAAQRMIAADEYRYISPVFSYDKSSGEVRRLLHVALTNTPALDDLPGVALAAARFFLSDHETQTEEASVKRDELIKLLGLAESASEQEISTALTALKTGAEQAVALRTEVAALKAAPASTAASPDPARFVPVQVVADLQQQVAALSARLRTDEVEQLVAGGLQDGRLLPSLEAWARDLGRSDVAALRAFLAAAQPIAALSGTQTGGVAPAQAGGGAVDESELAVCKLLGLSAEAYSAANKQGV